ncbi:MAG: hypothetical protein JXQ87_09135 [Bacteroidia bacterium]
MEPKLQPLSIESGWYIEWNQFYEIDPSNDAMHYFDSSSLLHLNNEHAHKALNLEWRPEADLEGEFILRFLQLKPQSESNDKRKNVRLVGDWDNPLYEIRGRNRLVIVDHIESLCRSHKPKTT